MAVPAAMVLAAVFLAISAPRMALAQGSAGQIMTCPEGDHPPQYPDPAPFRAAMALTSDITPWEQPVTGLTLPHHLVVPELIAGGYRLAAAEAPQRILVLMPDHFRRLETPFATSGIGYRTALGPVPGDPEAVALLVDAAAPGAPASPLVAESCLFGLDHALGSHLPFIAQVFPGVPVLPVAIGLETRPADWQALAERLAPLAGPGTLVVQSTDFSHYLPAWAARERDQEVLNLLAAGDDVGLAGLIQPDHVDSVGANWLQFTLQRDLHGSAPLVLANRNQQDLEPRPLAETTSYMVILYGPPGVVAPRQPFAGGNLHLLGGDFFIGRSWPRLLVDELASARVGAAALAATAGLPLVLNLEGVLLPEMPGTLPGLTLGMPADLALDWARRLNVVGFGLANNHVDDLGEFGRSETQEALAGAGIAFAGQGDRLELPGLTLVPLSDIRGGAEPKADLIDADLLGRLLVEDPSVPVVAFVHWGAEGQTTPGPRERALLAKMARRGVAAVIGAHPHVASAEPEAVSGGATLVIHSLGNFLFDQGAPSASGALAELRGFAQGTLFIRQLPLPVLHDLAR